MKIIPNKYPEEKNVDAWVKFVNIEQSKISAVFARRLAAMARDNGKVIIVSSGYRSYDEQKRLYDLYLAGRGNLAAPPNSSWHQYRSAVDIGDPENYWMTKSSKEWVPYKRNNQSSLNKYGLCLPLNKLEATSQIEWWHISPIEMASYAGEKSKFLDRDDKILNLEEIRAYNRETEKIVSGLVSSGFTSPDLWREYLTGKKPVTEGHLRAAFKKLLKI